MATRAPASASSSLLLLLLPPLAVGCAAGEPYDESYGGPGRADDMRSDDPDRIVDVPFYFSVPKSAVSVPLNRSAYRFPTVWNPSNQGDEAGLRLIVVDQGRTLAERRAARRGAAGDLSRAGVIQSGDIVLSFRPELADTMAYPHIQMGITHAGVMFIDPSGVTWNIDAPLTDTYIGQLDAEHYAGKIEDGAVQGGTEALHIVRPRNMTEERRRQFEFWVLEGRDANRAQVPFQDDYLSPAYFRQEMTYRQTVTRLGQIILRQTSANLPVYCSEFVWHMLALSACTREEIEQAGPEGADCVDPVFEPLRLMAEREDEFVLGEGPMLAMMAFPAELRASLMNPIFATGENAGRLSRGHRAVAEAVAPILSPESDEERLSQPGRAWASTIYEARIAGASVAETAASAAQLNGQFPPNYSPTAFLITAMGEDEIRPIDYVATIAFVNDEATMEKARELSQRPIP